MINLGRNELVKLFQIVSILFTFTSSRTPIHDTRVDQSSPSRQYSPEREVALISSSNSIVVVVQFFFFSYNLKHKINFAHPSFLPEGQIIQIKYE